MINRIRRYLFGRKYTPEEARALWVKALRSGKYKQGTGRLRGEDKSYCCLGVACDLYINNVGCKWQKMDYGYQFETTEPDESQGSILPVEVRDWLGLLTSQGSLSALLPRHPSPNSPLYGSLIELNDMAKFSFENIADVIESEQLLISKGS